MMVVQLYEYIENHFLIHLKIVNFMLYELFIYQKTISMCVMEHAFNPRTSKGEASGSLKVRGQPGLHNEFQDSQNYLIETLSQTK